MAFLLLNMTKERTELQHKINSLVDPLSGVANRRAFLNGANRLFAQQAVDREPLAVLLFDLDRFKAINDRMGHAVGDRVLQTFAEAATSTLGVGRAVRPHRRRGIRVHARRSAISARPLPSPIGCAATSPRRRRASRTAI